MATRVDSAVAVDVPVPAIHGPLSSVSSGVPLCAATDWADEGLRASAPAAVGRDPPKSGAESHAAIGQARDTRQTVRARVTDRLMSSLHWDGLAFPPMLRFRRAAGGRVVDGVGRAEANERVTPSRRM